MMPRVIWEGPVNGETFRAVLREVLPKPKDTAATPVSSPAIVVEVRQHDALNQPVWMRCRAETMGAIWQHLLILLALGEDQLLAPSTGEPTPA